jgi:hypothetical protein
MRAAAGLCTAVLVLYAAVAASGERLPCQFRRLGLEITVPDTPVAAGTPVRIAMVARFDTPTAALRLVATPGPGMRIQPDEFLVSGPWAHGDEYRFELEARATGADIAETEIELTAVDVMGRPAGLRRAVLSTLTQDGVTWVGAAGPANLALRRIAALRAAGRLSTSAAETAAKRLVTIAIAPGAEQHPMREAEAHVRALAEREAAWRLPEAGATSLRATVSAGTVSLTVSGHGAWTDSLGATHGIPFATVQILEDDGAQGTVVGTTATDAVGAYAITVSAHDNGGVGAAVAVEVLACSPFAEIRPEGELAQAYRLRSPVYARQTDGAKLTVNLTAGNTQDGETAFSLHHAFVVVGTYAASLAGEPPPLIPVLFPTSSTYFGDGAVHALLFDRWDWDVLEHEYAHHVARWRGLDDSHGGPHSGSDNLGATDKYAGIRLAWTEGWATFFAISAQAALGTAALGIPNVGDSLYTDTGGGNWGYDLETERGLGEDNEISVQVALWDLFDSADDGVDHITLPRGDDLPCPRQRESRHLRAGVGGDRRPAPGRDARARGRNRGPGRDRARAARPSRPLRRRPRGPDARLPLAPQRRRHAAPARRLPHPLLDRGLARDRLREGARRHRRLHAERRGAQCDPRPQQRDPMGRRGSEHREPGDAGRAARALLGQRPHAAARRRRATRRAPPPPPALSAPTAPHVSRLGAGSLPVT